jgi:hypothetical protein
MPIERLPPKPGSWTVTKRQVIAGHLSRALDLYILRDDPLSAHLLCGAARDIAHDLAKAEGKDKLWDHVRDSIREDKQFEFFGLMKDEYNFLKHANPDRPAVMDHYTTAITSIFLWETCVNVEQLFGQRFTETTLYQVWFMSWHPGFAKDEYAATLDTLRTNGANLYDDQGRMKWESLQEGFKLITAKRARTPAGPMEYLAHRRAGPPKDVDDPG